MKRIVIISVLLGLILGAVSTAEAGKKRKKPKKITRTVEVTYDGPAIGVGAVGIGACLVALNSCGEVPTGPDDLYMMVEVTDQSGTDVSVDLGQDTDPNALGTETDLGSICGKSETPIAIQAPGVPITTFPWAIGGPSCPGVGTTGTIKFTFSNLP